MFRQRHNYRAAAKVFTQWSLPTEQLCLLFAEMFPKRYVDDLLMMFPDLQQTAKQAVQSSSASAKSTPQKSSGSQGGSAKPGFEPENMFMSQADILPARDESAQ